MIVGVGIDVVDITRFMETLERTPSLRARLFTPAESVKPPSSLAARFAAKEALAKALGAPGGLLWLDAEVTTDSDGRPWLEISGTVAARASQLGVQSMHLSLSHDAGIASAVVVLGGLMRVAHTVEQVRAAEAALMARLPEGTLMQRAATGLATAIADFLGSIYGARIVLLIGSGDNGGDALYAGAQLARRGAQVGAVLQSDRVHPAGLKALKAAGGRVVEPSAIESADLVVDGIVGIGGRPGLRLNAASVLDLVERYAVPVVAVDVPSGVEVDTGATPERHVHAALTVTFGTHKVCHLIDPAATACGPVHLVDIGLDLPAPAAEALQPADIARLYAVPDRGSDKYSRGVTGLMAGSEQYPGAAVLAAGGALGGPLGMVRYAGPDSVATVVRAAHPEVVAGRGRVQSWVIGSGLGEHVDARLISEIFAAAEPAVIDADGLRYLPLRFTSPVLLTPHAGELSRLLDVPRDLIEAQRLEHARAAARRWNATVLLKGSTTVIAAPDGRVRVNTNATPWLATAGAGDVLAGLCGALLASGLDPLDAGSVGAHLHAAAARLASDGGPVTAAAVAAALPAATAAVLSSAAR